MNSLSFETFYIDNLFILRSNNFLNNLEFPNITENNVLDFSTIDFSTINFSELNSTIGSMLDFSTIDFSDILNSTVGSTIDFSSIMIDFSAILNSTIGSMMDFSSILGSTIDYSFNFGRLINFSVVSNEKKNDLLSIEDYEKLEKRDFNMEDAIINNYNLECPISIKDFDNNDNIVILPCNHIFIEDKIKFWLTKSSNNCPICRKKVNK